MKLCNANKCLKVLFLTIVSVGALNADALKVAAAWYGVEGMPEPAWNSVSTNTDYKGKSVAEIIQTKMVKDDKIVMPTESFNDLFGDTAPGKVKLVAINVQKPGYEVNLRISESVNKNFVWAWGDTEMFDPALLKNKAGVVSGDAYLKAFAKASAAAAAVVTPPPASKVDVVVSKVDPDNHPEMPAVKVDANAWKLVEPAKDDKPIEAVLMDKGAGNDGLTLKMVSVCDANNVWVVANDGKKDAVYQLRSKGLEHSFDGVFVSAGKGIVAAINDKQEVFELEGGTGDAWKKVDGLKLSKIARPSHDVGWGLLETGKGGFSCFMYDHGTKKWVGVKNAQGQDAKGIVDLSANAEDVVLALTDKGEILKRDMTRVELHEAVQAAVTEIKKGGKKALGKAKKAAHGAAAEGKKAKKAVHDTAADADHGGKPDAKNKKDKKDHKKGQGKKPADAKKDDAKHAA